MDEKYLLISEKFKKSWWNTKEYVLKFNELSSFTINFNYENFSKRN